MVGIDNWKNKYCHKLAAFGQKQPVDLAHISGELLLKADIQRCVKWREPPRGEASK